MNKICILIPYFGSFPPYLSYFFLCCSHNPEINWLLLTDQEKPRYCPENVFYKFMALGTFNKLATEKLGFPVEIIHGYKLCDFKPAYGLIFEDFIKDYEFWGYSDVDVFLGNLVKFLPLSKLNESDIISTYRSFLSGPFCLFRNNNKINTLFRMNPDHRSILQDKKYNGFDENIPRKEIQGFSYMKLIYFALFLLLSLIELRFYSFSFSEFRYQFQWYYKKITIRKEILSDMTEIVLYYHKHQDLRLFFAPVMLSDSHFKRIANKKWCIRWKNGKLYYLKNGTEIFGFHFRESKKNMEFVIDSFNPFMNGFSVSETGLINDR
jgi:hypothetical protein